MDSNKKKNSVRYKCQVRDINKKACLTRASTLTFVLSRKLLEAVAARAAPFLMQLSRQLCCRFASAKTQMQVQRAAEHPPVVRRTAPSNMRIKLTAKLKSRVAFSLLAAYPPPVVRIPLKRYKI